MSRTGRERRDDTTQAFSKDNYSRETEHNILLSLDIMFLIFTKAESGLCGYTIWPDCQVYSCHFEVDNFHLSVLIVPLAVYILASFCKLLDVA